MLGIGLMLVAWLVFSCIDTSAKWLALAGIPALQLSFMRYAGHFVISLVLIGRGGLRPARFASRHLLLVVIRGALLMCATVLNFIAVRYLPLTLTSTILFSAPIIICTLSWPLLGERVGLWRWSAIIVGFFGILIAIRPEPLYDARYIIPITGMILGNCLRSNVLSLERFYSSIRKNQQEFTTYLLLGATLHEAIRPYLRNALKSAVKSPVIT